MSPKTKLAPKSPPAPTALLGDIRALINSAHQRAQADLSRRNLPN